MLSMTLVSLQSLCRGSMCPEVTLLSPPWFTGSRQSLSSSLQDTASYCSLSGKMVGVLVLSLVMVLLRGCCGGVVVVLVLRCRYGRGCCYVFVVLLLCCGW